MKRSIRHILLLWSGLLTGLFLALSLLDHHEMGTPQVLNVTMQMLLFLICLEVFKREPSRKTKVLFLNFTIFFAYSVLFSTLSFFVGKVIFVGKPFAMFYYYEYALIGYVTFLAVGIIYLVVDAVLKDFRIYQKYLLSIALVCSLVVFYFFPILNDPLYLYSTEDIKQWKELNSNLPQNAAYVTAEELATKVRLQSWRDGAPVGELYPEQNLRRIEALLPYLEGNNYQILLSKPLFINVMYVDVALVFFMLLFFGYQYKKDPPQGAYVDKIVFVFLLFVSTEILHFWGYTKSIEYSSYQDVFLIGQYITTFLFVMLALFFGLRLRFISSVHGEFYETELATNPQTISRWRDWIDNLIIAKFFSLKSIQGRLFQQAQQKN